MSVVATIAQVVAALSAMVAAFAAVRSSGAALRTAERADLTSERAAEALSRAVRPDLYVRLDTKARRGADPQPAELVVINRAPHGGVLIGARIEHRDGTVMAEYRPSVSIAIGARTSGRPSDDAEYLRRLPIGRVPRAVTDVRLDEIQFPPPQPNVAYVIEFSDASQLTQWAQRGEINELVSVSRPDDGGELVAEYRYETVERGMFEPEPLRGTVVAAQSHRRWLRRR